MVQGLGTVILPPVHTLGILTVLASVTQAIPAALARTVQQDIAGAAVHALQ